ncbi:uncharacterized protein BO80DRAFT_376241 [Aspergillus ibericus CBS 121593]|uniref:Inner centromere protein ARK-binding domain-containing protein n=1 Tax=Aspergillus ibericus CBS 121593 TaxID=1448316 RepID=A0A395H8M8_9EURO|nr:hypothetical protein BO80DRAFT_376241 [Aspergillus ibericus CBS 121593]RAL03929.1 hypothetical protein BO80DRAFT_376241 [Aspergillus ibericus CBS 121593]
MAAAGARAQKPVGSAAWISTEKENFMQLVDQEMEEVEYPVRHEMDWLNEHMAEVFSNNQPNFADVFKTPGKLRGKTPRTARKRDANEPRVPLSEIFSSAHNHGKTENKLGASPAIQRSPTKALPPATAAPAITTETKKITETTTHSQYPDLSQNLNSFPQYNTDSGYHGMPEEDEEEDDDVVLTQVQPESQSSTQPMDQEPTIAEEQSLQPLEDRRNTEASFHSAQEDVRQREETVEPVTIESSPKRNVGTDSPKKQPGANKTEHVAHGEPELEDKPMPDLAPEQEQESESESEPEPEPEHGDDLELESEHAPEPEPESEHEHELEPVPKSTPQRISKPKEQFAPEPEPEPKPFKDAESTSPLKTPAAQSPEHQQEEKDDEKDDMALDSLDEIGSPSESSPVRPPIRKSSLSFASLPAREPLMKKSLGGPRVSRTSHLDFAKLSSTGGYLGRQTGGHRTTQHALEDNTIHGDKMDVDDKKDGSDEEPDAETRASKLQTKSSTQLLHEKISMLGKLQPSRPTKSIPSVSGLSAAQVTYPELPTTKSDAKQETSSQKSRDTQAPEPSAVDDDWIKPLNSPYKPGTRASQKADSMSKHSSARIARAADDDRPSVDRDHESHLSEAPKVNSKRTSDAARGKSSTPMYSSPQRSGHQKSASANIDHQMSTTPVGSPAERYDGPLSASKFRLQSIVQSAKGLFTNTAGVAAAARTEAASPDAPRLRHKGRLDTDRMAGSQRPQSTQPPSPPRQEGRRTRSSTEREEKRRQQELEERQREEEQAERTRQQEKQRVMKLRTTQEKSTADYEARGPATEPTAAQTTQKMSQLQKPSKEPESSIEAGPRIAAQLPASQQQASKQNDRRPLKPTRELQKPKPQPVSIRVGSALSRQMPLASQVSSSTRESSVPAPTPASASKQPTLKKKASNTSLHTASSNSSFKSSISSQTQRKAQLASERKREQEEREARRREEQRREVERKRAAQQQEEARRQEMRSRAETERRERLAAEDPKKAAHMQAIEKRRLENQRRLERQGSQQPEASQRSELGAARPASRLGSIQPFNRSINQPQPNPAKPPKRGLDDETSHRPTAPKTATMQPSGESKRRRTEDEQSRMSSMRPAMAPPIRQSNIRKPSIFGHAQPSVPHQSGSSIFKTAQAQRPAHPLDMAKYASGKIPFAEPSNVPPAAHRTPAASASQKVPVKESPNYPNGENINLPEIATDSEDEDSDAEMLPVPKWAQPKELESLLRQQEGMEVDSIFGPIAPFSLEETFKSDKKIKKFRERTSSANWSGADGLTQEEIRRDLAERQRLRLNGGWSFN